MYALDMSIGKQNVLGIRKGPNKKFVQDITFCYDVVLQTCQYKCLKKGPLISDTSELFWLTSTLTVWE